MDNPWFQSTPVIANGRILSGAKPTDAIVGFNPRPLLLTGESQAHRLGVGPAQRFNPRPLLLTGESSRGQFSRVAIKVSIHARYC